MNRRATFGTIADRLVNPPIALIRRGWAEPKTRDGQEFTGDLARSQGLFEVRMPMFRTAEYHEPLLLATRNRAARDTRRSIG
jgi:hypothetical protein